MSDSIWKKEIHLRKPKQPKAEKVVEQPKVEAPKPEPATSFWKKERSLRKPKVEVSKPGPATSFWKKERHVRKQPDPLPPLPETLLAKHRDATPRGMVVVPVVPARDSGWPSVDEPPLPEATVEEPPYEAPDAEKTLDLPVPDLWEESKPESTESVGELLQRYSVTPLPRPESVAEAIEAFEPEPEPEPAPVAELFERYTGRLVTPEPEPEPEVVALEEPEPEPEPVAPAAEKVPLLKREIRLRRPKREKAPKAKPEPKAAAPAAEKVPLLKREIHLGRRNKPAKAKREKRNDTHKITNVVGLRIGSTQVTAAHVRNNGSAEVLQLANLPLERGVIVAGEVREPVALAKALKTLFAQNKLPKKTIRLGVASNRIGVRVLDVPSVEDPKQFENAIRFRAQESLPIPVADAVLDHVVLGEEPTEDGEVMRRVLLVFAHRELVTRYVEVCRQAGLKLAGIDLDAFALLRAIGPEPNSDARRASVAVAVGHERTVFAVSDGEICDFTRVLEWGSNTIDVAIARALNLAPSQAEPLKLALDLTSTEPPAGLSPMQFEVARAAVTEEIGHLARELLSSLRFYQSRPGSLDLSEVVLSGGGAELSGFAEEVQGRLGVPVRVADPFARVSLAKKVKTPESAGSYAVAVGLGIEA